MTWNQSGSQDVGSDGAEDDCQDEEDDGVGVGCGCVQCFGLQLATRCLGWELFLRCTFLRLPLSIFCRLGSIRYFLQILRHRIKTHIAMPLIYRVIQ